jgi:hypothetical protein
MPFMTVLLAERWCGGKKLIVDKNKTPSMNADNRLWGPSIWVGANYIAFAYPEKPTPLEQSNVIQYFQSMATVLPCSKCRTHFQQLLKDFPIQADSRDALTRWLVEAHNRVNVRLNKPRLDYEFVKSQYEFLQSSVCKGVDEACPSTPAPADCAPKSNNNTKYVVCIGAGVILLGIAVVFAIRHNQKHSR